MPIKREYIVALLIFLVLALGLFLGLLTFAAVGPAEWVVDGDLEAATIRVAKGLYCPVCPGVPLDVCETQACEQWRQQIRDKLAQGESPAQIEAFFVEQYGERVLGAPRAEGFNVAVYALPALLVAGGAALLYLLAHRWVRSRPPTVETAGTVVDPEYRERIEQELRELE